MQGKIIGPNAVDPWTHSLFRPAFSFTNVAGKLDRFRLRCDRHSLEGAIDTDHEWRVPDSWGDCTLLVYGALNSAFTVLAAQ